MKTIPSGSPLDRWIKTLTAPMPTEEEIAEARRHPPPPAELRGAFYDVREAQRLAWSVRVIHSPRNVTSTVSDGLVSNELVASDTRLSPAGRQMPGGTGLLYQAARFLQLSSGRVEVYGLKSPGMDLLWITPSGGRVAIERKDSAFFQAISERNPVQIEHFFKDRLIKAAEKFPATPGAARVISVGYGADVKTAALLQAQFRDLISKIGQGMDRALLPDAAYGAFFGYDIVGDREIAEDKGIFLEISHEGYRLRPEFMRVREDLKKVYGTRVKRRGR